MVDKLQELLKKYNDGEYDIADVSRIISYMAIPNVNDEYLKQVEYQIEWIRFMTSDSSQKEKINSLLEDLIKKSIENG
jgi:hypothetical protein